MSHQSAIRTIVSIDSKSVILYHKNASHHRNSISPQIHLYIINYRFDSVIQFSRNIVAMIFQMPSSISASATLGVEYVETSENYAATDRIHFGKKRKKYREKQNKSEFENIPEAEMKIQSEKYSL